MNYKKNLILLLSLVNIAIVIFLIVNNKKREKFQACPPASAEEGPVCNVPEDDQPTSLPEALINPADYILYFIIEDSPTECETTITVSDIFDTYFSNPDFTELRALRGTISDFKSFIGCNLFSHPCSAFCTRSPWILIRYPYTREFRVLNNLTARIYNDNNTFRRIFSVNSVPDALEFVELAKQSYAPNVVYSQDRQNTLASYLSSVNTDFSNPNLCQGTTARIANATSETINPNPSCD